MAQIRSTFSAHCPRCDKDVDFEINLRYVEYNGCIPCFKCPSCGVECPEYSFGRFLSDGKVIIAV